MVKLGSASRPAPGELDARDAQPDLYRWRRVLLSAMPFAALAFVLGIAFELAGEPSAFDLAAYSSGTLFILLLEGLLYRYPERLAAVVSLLTGSMSLFFIGKLVYLLFFAAAGTDILSELTESFFWAPVVYVLAFFIPGVRLGRLSVGVFAVLTPAVSAAYLLTHLARPEGLELAVIYALVQLNLATVVMILLTRSFAVLQAHLSHARSHSEVMKQLAHTDTLTGTPNRLSLETALAAALAAQEPFAVFFIDLDRFKRVNDTQGHSTGDALLCSVALRLQGLVREGDLLARVSGDEFVLLARSVGSEQAAEGVAHKLQGAFETPFRVFAQPLRIGASIGFCRYPQDGGDAKTLLQHADSAMYRAKAGGRGGLERFSLDDGDTELRRALEKDLVGAADRGELTLIFQPLYSLSSGQLVKVEALARWQHPTRGGIAPDVFIPLAEESGEIVPIGHWVLRSACQTAAAWRRSECAAVTMAVNISSTQFSREGFFGEVRCGARSPTTASAAATSNSS